MSLLTMSDAERVYVRSTVANRGAMEDLSDESGKMMDMY